jgi:CBS domain containing-hemolysin-like protein
MLSRVFTLNDKTVEKVMVPRDKMAVFDINTPAQEILETIIRTGYTRFPVKEGRISKIVGFVHAKDVFRIVHEKHHVPVRKIIRPPYFVPAEKTIDVLLRKFQAKKLHQAVVLDSAGKTVGLITLEDILEQLVGSIEDEHDY